MCGVLAGGNVPPEAVRVKWRLLWGLEGQDVILLHPSIILRHSPANGASENCRVWGMGLGKGSGRGSPGWRGGNRTELGKGKGTGEGMGMG